MAPSKKGPAAAPFALRPPGLAVTSNVRLPLPHRRYLDFKVPGPSVAVPWDFVGTHDRLWLFEMTSPAQQLTHVYSNQPVTHPGHFAPAVAR